MRSERKYHYVLLLVFVGAVAIQVLAPEPLDWSPSFSRHDTVPYGSRVVFEVLDDLMPGASVRALQAPPFVVLEHAGRGAVEGAGTYVFVADAFSPDEAEAARLLDYVSDGGTVFVAARTFGGALADTLHLETGMDRSVPSDTLDRFALVHPALHGTAYGLPAGTADRFFTRFDTSRATVLGTTVPGTTVPGKTASGAAGAAAPNYVRLAWGEGAFLVSTVPYAFTNYSVLEGGAGYVAGAWSYLPEGDVWWDEHYKPGRAAAATPLRFVLAAPALRWAYGLGLVALLLFVVFRAKRRQRVVPVVAPPRNTTLDFVATVGRLYYQHGDHANLAAKRVAYFLDHIRTRLRLPTGSPDADLRAKVAERAGVGPAVVDDVFDAIERTAGRTRVTEDELNRLSRTIERFHAASRAAARERSSSPTSRSV